MGFFRSVRSSLRSFLAWFNNLSYKWKIPVGIVLTGIFAFLAIFFPDFEPLAEAPSWFRFAIVIFLFINFFWSVIALWERGERTDQLSEENRQLKENLAATGSELQQLEEEKQSLLQIDELIWERPDSGSNQFVHLSHRKSVIVSVLNLKGGVGKTTLSANLAACLATADKPLRTLIVDLDFQGTLSDMCVEQGTLTLLRQTKSTVSSLLSEQSDFSILHQVAVPMTRVPGASIICAFDRLDTLDFRLQAQFFLEPEREVRFLFQRIFHDPKISQIYDLVLFDCPPRLTTSVINALTCSDFILIPTKLDRSSVTAVPRTLRWLATMGNTVRAQPLGVIANETQLRKGKLISDHQNAYNFLAKNLIPPAYGNLMFEKTVAFSNQVGHTKSIGVVAALDEQAKTVFAEVAEELRTRLPL